MSGETDKDDMPRMDVVEWKAMARRMLHGSLTSSDEFVEWVCDCALHAYENGDVSEDVAKLLEANEQMILAKAQP